jgi:archaellum biogenesis ATPase FlaH
VQLTEAGVQDRATREGAIMAAIETHCPTPRGARPYTAADVRRLAAQGARYADPLTAAVNGKRTHPEPEPARLTVYTTAELLDAPPPEYVYSDMIPRGGLVTLSGPSGDGKTFEAIHIASSIAQAGGRVLYVAAEGGRGAIGARAQAWADYHETPAPPIVWIAQSVDAISDLDELIDHAGQADLVVLDTLARVLPADLDENSSKDIGALVRAADRLREATSGAVMLVHHSGWDQSRERGSSALRAACDAFLHMRRSSDDQNVIELRCVKMKDAESWAPRYLRIKPLGGIFGERKAAVIIPSEAPATSAVPLDREQAIIDYLAEYPASSGRAIRLAVKGDNGAIGDALRELERRGKIKLDGRKWTVCKWSENGLETV